MTLAQYTDGPGMWGNLTSQRRGNDSAFYGYDLSSNTRSLTDASGHPVASYVYDAFGNELNASGSDPNPFRYGGKVGYASSEDSGLVYVRARWYDPSTGRWISKDPIGFRGRDWNLYRYVGNEPVLKNDPDGLSCPCTPAQIAQCREDAATPCIGPGASLAVTCAFGCLLSTVGYVLCLSLCEAGNAVGTALCDGLIIALCKHNQNCY